MRELTARLFAEWIDKSCERKGKRSLFLARGVLAGLLEKYKELLDNALDELYNASTDAIKAAIED